MTSKPTSGPRDGQPGLVGRLVAAIRGRIAGIFLFIRQVVAELRKVVRPTRSELITYTAAVLAFVLVIMSFVSAIDFGIGKLVLFIFGGSN